MRESSIAWLSSRFRGDERRLIDLIGINGKVRLHAHLDAGFSAEPITWQHFARTRWRCPE
jgi:hypothetical protein